MKIFIELDFLLYLKLLSQENSLQKSMEMATTYGSTEEFTHYKLQAGRKDPWAAFSPAKLG